MSVTGTERRRLPASLLVAGLLAGCSGGPPGQSTEPIAARSARLDDTTGIALPAPASADFCLAAQQILASTSLTGSNTLFTDMPEYRHSKPSADPHRVYQVVTYSGAMPVVVSCKTKTAAHLRAVYGPDAAGTQYFCPELARRVQRQAVAELTAAGQAEPAARAAAIVVDDNEPYLTGRDYLKDFELSYRAADGTVHLNSPGLFQNYDSWITRFLPWQVQGQSYCHVATLDYVKAVARGDTAPGLVITTGDNATVTPR
ncbi:MAG: hypothetical protein OEW44_06100 [Gemmatimonadota bacterium]|nr:hypothetical protein [Gemmatimonadota bacterium]